MLMVQVSAVMNDKDKDMTTDEVGELSVNTNTDCSAPDPTNLDDQHWPTCNNTTRFKVSTLDHFLWTRLFCIEHFISGQHYLVTLRIVLFESTKFSWMSTLLSWMSLCKIMRNTPTNLQSRKSKNHMSVAQCLRNVLTSFSPIVEYFVEVINLNLNELAWVQWTDQRPLIFLNRTYYHH